MDPSHNTPLDYASAGVDYGPLDAFKRACQVAAGSTRELLSRHGMAEPADVRGESAYLLETPQEYLAHVEEGLGTKNLIADAMSQLTGKSHYHAIGIDTVATIANDLITCGALPVCVAMHAGVGDSAWFHDTIRAADLAAGFAEGCRRAGAVWGGGETPTLRGVIDPGAIVLAGSAVGRVRPKSNRVTGHLRAGDAIVFLASSGVHTNGLTLCRAAAARLPEGYLTRCADGRTFGEAVLTPSVIYVDFVRAAQEANLKLPYVAHVTGHGWRKLMRAPRSAVYRIDTPPPVPAEIALLIDAGIVDRKEAYATFNMGVGFAAYVRPNDAERCVSIARDAGYHAWVAGSVVEVGKRKAVEVPSLGLSFDGSTLDLRG